MAAMIIPTVYSAIQTTGFSKFQNKEIATAWNTFNLIHQIIFLAANKFVGMVYSIQIPRISVMILILIMEMDAQNIAKFSQILIAPTLIIIFLNATQLFLK